MPTPSTDMGSMWAHASWTRVTTTTAGKATSLAMWAYAEAHVATWGPAWAHGLWVGARAGLHGRTKGTWASRATGHAWAHHPIGTWTHAMHRMHDVTHGRVHGHHARTIHRWPTITRPIATHVDRHGPRAHTRLTSATAHPWVTRAT